MGRTIFYIVLYAMLNVSGAALIKWHLKDRQLQNLQQWLVFMLDLKFILAFLLIMGSALAMFKALSGSNFSLIIPIATGINFMITVFAGYWLFRDRLSIYSFLGFLLILCGIIILSINNQIHAQQNLSE